MTRYTMGARRETNANDGTKRMTEAEREELILEITRLREENARLKALLDDAFAQWDGDWPEELVARVKATISNKGGKS